jgi:hypothetical protein
MTESTDKFRDINPGNIMLTVDDDTILEISRKLKQTTRHHPE